MILRWSLIRSDISLNSFIEKIFEKISGCLSLTIILEWIFDQIFDLRLLICNFWPNLPINLFNANFERWLWFFIYDLTIWSLIIDEQPLTSDLWSLSSNFGRDFSPKLFSKFGPHFRLYFELKPQLNILWLRDKNPRILG